MHWGGWVLWAALTLVKIIIVKLSLMCGVLFELGALIEISPSCTDVNWYLILMVVGLRFYLTANI